ncbi:MAG: TAT-variant-translocated molybdopterin oxidoreductase [Phycisphaerales bacterium]|nr:TAT-variant-translocated molybdopterin oxidoreductase [Phycisphaerales bacterium]
MSPVNGEKVVSGQLPVVGEKLTKGGCCADEGKVSGIRSEVSGDKSNLRFEISDLKGKQYWRSLDELANTEEFREFMFREFPAGASEILDSEDRRQFLKVMGASLALAGMGMAGCRRWPQEKIAPYAHRPAGRTPGVPVQYATMMELGGVAAGLLVTSFDGRPIKIEGNPQHPINQGATDVHAQASVLDLYDPDRSQSVMKGGVKATWADFENWAKEHIGPRGGGIPSSGGGPLHSVAILSEATSSPSVQALRQKLVGMGATWHEYEPLNNDNEVKGSELAFGAPHRAHYSFEKARTIVSLDSDFLHCDAPGSAAVKWTRDFAAGRRMPGSHDPNFQHASMSRLYVFESGVSLTGANADERVAMRSADVAVIAARLAAKLAPDATSPLAGLLSDSPMVRTSRNPTGDSKAMDDLLDHVAADLQANHGASIVIAGARQPAEVHALAHLINDALGNAGQTIKYTRLGDAVKHVESIQALATGIEAGKFQTLVILGGNPVYNAPADLNFGEVLKRVPNTVHLGDYFDETGAACTWHVNRAHYLETWGDGRAYDGTVCIGQPLIEPLFGGKSAIELLATIAGEEKTDGYEIVRRTFGEMNGGPGNAPGNFEAAWRTALHDGIVRRAETADASPSIQRQALGASAEALRQQRKGAGANEVELVFAADASVYDGRFANNGWLQELPDPVVKLTWDNAVLMSPSAASMREIRDGDMVRISAGGRELTAAAMIVPGHYVGSMTLTLGYGREFGGRICKGAGFDFYRVRASDAMGFVGGAVVTKTGETYALAITQNHHPIDAIGKRGLEQRLPTLFREATVEQYKHHPDFVNHRTHVLHRLSLWEEDLPFQSETKRAGSQYAWAMSIDLNTCTGCNACVIACQAENNIPIVGKDQVRRGREMHWIRVDRYFQGSDPEAPKAMMLAPIPCMHCENAPCEEVCPVAATVHDEQGLNVMVYNRCIGTRYCSNNCPYKVRRFNYFDYHARGPLREQPGVLMQVEPDYYAKGSAEADPLKQMQFNPEVTVRMRGIMEKCTYCVQRITKARIEAKNAWVAERNLDPDANLDLRVPIEDGTFTTACAQACPAQAIVFGDLNDPNSRVSKLHKHERTYQMLEELNNKPRTRYMAKIRNPAFEPASQPGGGTGHEGAASHDGGHG